MPKLTGYATHEGGYWTKCPLNLHVTSIEIRHYPPTLYKALSNVPGSPWRALHDSIPFEFFSLLFDDNSVWDAHLAATTPMPEEGHNALGWTQLDYDPFKEEQFESVS